MRSGQEFGFTNNFPVCNLPLAKRRTRRGLSERPRWIRADPAGNQRARVTFSGNCMREMCALGERTSGHKSDMATPGFLAF